MSEPMFPILNDPIIKCIPWALIQPHEKQAQTNHSQTLRGLAGRGGLSICEAYYILSDKPYPIQGLRQTHEVKASYRSALMRIALEFEKEKTLKEALASDTTEGSADA
ncbi:MULTISPECIES: hypothetical protein [Rhizobium/Agrobacterium group]|uniref:hypothetical protein n=1 Tax=Rhizobium/Agrobacterium group TaxID=227290 RepID=UPI0005A08FC9|nr:MULTISPECIES: hypothetical protein [Rhizobium/Agrobacterium group]MUO30822.1 hypothetical protein [Agrobacterium vitis]